MNWTHETRPRFLNAMQWKGNNLQEVILLLNRYAFKGEQYKQQSIITVRKGGYIVATLYCTDWICRYEDTPTTLFFTNNKKFTEDFRSMNNLEQILDGIKDDILMNRPQQ